MRQLVLLVMDERASLSVLRDALLGRRRGSGMCHWAQSFVSAARLKKGGRHGAIIHGWHHAPAGVRIVSHQATPIVQAQRGAPIAGACSSVTGVSALPGPLRTDERAPTGAIATMRLTATPVFVLGH